MKNITTRRALGWVLRLLGVALFVAILARLDMQRLAAAARSADGRWMALAMLLTFPFVVTRSQRWLVLLRQQGIAIRLRDAIAINYVGAFLGSITPGRLGELGKVFYVKGAARGFSHWGCLLAIVADRLIDIVTLLLVALAGVAFFLRQSSPAGAVAAACSLLCLVVLYLLKERVMERAEGLLRRIGSRLGDGEDANEGEGLAGRLKRIGGAGLPTVLLANASAWVLFYLTVPVIARSCNVAIGVFYLATSTSSAMVLSMLPITIGGVGVRDIVLVFFFSRIGIPDEMAVLYSLMYLLVCVLFPAVVGFAIHLLVGLPLKPRFGPGS